MTREKVVNSMSLQDAIQVFKDTNCYGTMDIAKTVILKALEQEPCTDAISREELLRAIDTWDKFGYTETGCFVREPKGDYVPYIHYDDVIKSIKGMPSATPQYTDAEIQKMQELEFAEIQKAYELGKEEGRSENPNKWIPVSEMLPKYNKTVLISVKQKGKEATVFIAQRRKRIKTPDIFECCTDYDGWWDFRISAWDNHEVIAWMPLPEPYKASPTGAEGSDKE